MTASWGSRPRLYAVACFAGLVACDFRANVFLKCIRDWRAFRLSSILRSQSNARVYCHLKFKTMIIHRQNRAMIGLHAAVFLIYPLLAFAQRPPAPQELKYSPQLTSEIKKV